MTYRDCQIAVANDYIVQGDAYRVREVNGSVQLRGIDYASLAQFRDANYLAHLRSVMSA